MQAISAMMTCRTGSLAPAAGAEKAPGRPVSAAAGENAAKCPAPATGSEDISGRPASAAKETRPLQRTRDTYLPGERPPSAGCYRPGRDANGRPAVLFDAPAQTDGSTGAKAPAPDAGEDEKDAEEPAKGSRKKTAEAESCTCSTDRVDREIAQLKQQKARLAQQLRTETNTEKAQKLEQTLAQVERALAQKDNDAYRRAHAVFT